MRDYRFSLTSGLIGTVFAFVATEAVNLFRQAQVKQLNKAKLDITDSLNQEIGYHRCKIDELKELKNKFQTKNIFKKISNKRQTKELSEKITDEEFQIRALEQRINEIRSSNNMKMLRYVENRSAILESTQTIKLLPSTVKGY